ncbi:MAG: rhomboid family intramembrane serine protease [Solirubrobacterales bacterium]
MSGTELSVICKNCGSEVSPYVTECPYCGTRLRKRAPKLERRGDGLEAKTRGATARFRRLRKRAASIGSERPYVTIFAIGLSAALLLIQKATGASLSELGALTVPIEGEWWRLVTGPFVHENVGYLFVVALGLAIFSTGLERRFGSLKTAALLLIGGAAGMLCALGAASWMDETTLIAGGNGMALAALTGWALTSNAARARDPFNHDYDRIAVIVAGAVLFVLPIVQTTASFAAAGGGILAASCLTVAWRWPK